VHCYACNFLRPGQSDAIRVGTTETSPSSSCSLRQRYHDRDGVVHATLAVITRHMFTEDQPQALTSAGMVGRRDLRPYGASSKYQVTNLTVIRLGRVSTGILLLCVLCSRISHVENHTSLASHRAHACASFAPISQRAHAKN
jgi:hypothetical protein